MTKWKKWCVYHTCFRQIYVSQWRSARCAQIWQETMTNSCITHMGAFPPARKYEVWKPMYSHTLVTRMHVFISESVYQVRNKKKEIYICCNRLLFKQSQQEVVLIRAALLWDVLKNVWHKVLHTHLINPVHPVWRHSSSSSPDVFNLTFLVGHIYLCGGWRKWKICLGFKRLLVSFQTPGMLF